MAASTTLPGAATFGSAARFPPPSLSAGGAPFRLTVSNPSRVRLQSSFIAPPPGSQQVAHSHAISHAQRRAEVDTATWHSPPRRQQRSAAQQGGAGAASAASRPLEVRSGVASFGVGELEGQYIENLKGQVKLLEGEVDYMRGQLRRAGETAAAQATAELEAQLGTQAAAWTARESELEAVLAEQRSELEAALHTKRRLEAQLENERTARERGREEHAGRDAALAKAAEAAERECEHQAQQVQQARARQQQLLAHARELEEALEDARRQLRARDAALAARDQTAQQRSEELAGLQATVTDLREEAAKQARAAAPEVMHAGQREAHELRLRLKDLELTTARERAAHTQAAEDMQAVLQENARLTGRVGELEAALAQERQSTVAHRDRHLASVREMHSLQEHAEQTGGDATRLGAELRDTQVELARLRKERATLDAAREAAEQDAFDLREDMAWLRQQLKVRFAVVGCVPASESLLNLFFKYASMYCRE